jgi:primosomal replication protein N
VEANRVVLDGRLSERGELRFTPAGVPAIDFTLQHSSVQVEAGIERNVSCEIAAVAFGEVARKLAGIPADCAIRCKGFIARRWRTGITLALHVRDFEELTDNIREDTHASSTR